MRKSARIILTRNRLIIKIKIKKYFSKTEHFYFYFYLFIFGFFILSVFFFGLVGGTRCDAPGYQ
jgi:hypothetical protein